MIRSEAKAQQNQLSDAITDLDVIRQRAGLPAVSTTNPTINQTELLKLIYNERRLEFFAERGLRWFDLRRLHEADPVLKPLKQNWDTTDQLYPIPLSELKLNSFLKQNAGY